MPSSKQTTKKQKQPKTEKSTKQTKVKKVKAKKVSEIPKIVHPRVINKVSFDEYMDSFINNIEYRRNVVKQLYEEKKCPNACVLHLNAVLKEVEAMKKRVGKRIITKRRNTGNHGRGALVAPCLISDELAKFLGVKSGTRMGRAEVNRAVTAYIHWDPETPVPEEPEKSDPEYEEKHRKVLNFKNKTQWAKKLNKDGKVRNLQDPETKSIILPDAALAKLLKYKEYQKAVKAGKIQFNQTDPETKEKRKVVREDDILTYSVLQHLLARHFIKDDSPAEEEPDQEDDNDESEVASDEDEE